mgnify:CR=1 FL=1|jgi:hypothetical protein
MELSQATTNMVTALIDIKCITTAEEAAEAYKTIYAAVSNPYKG